MAAFAPFLVLIDAVRERPIACVATVWTSDKEAARSVGAGAARVMKQCGWKILSAKVKEMADVEDGSEGSD
jgi:hypothetical protein